jgi:hypothetical protein
MKRRINTKKYEITMRWIVAREWRQLLELKLTRSSLTEFQIFHPDLMSRIHRDDYLPVRQHARFGDGGMDGHLLL